MTKYPKAHAAIARLLGEEAPSNAPFTIGPAIFRAPAGVAVPPPPAIEVEAGETETDALLGELVDMVLVGDPEGGAKHEVHLVFKAEVLGGLHLKLAKKAGGLFCSFLVADANSRRMVEGHVDELLVRLRDRGFKVAGHEVVVRT